MNSDRLSRRLTVLEDSSAEQDIVTISYRWLNEDGTPAGPLIERTIPRSESERFKFEWIDDEK